MYSNEWGRFSVLAIRLPPEIEERLERLAKLTGRTKTYYAREAILEHLEDLEDTYLAVERLQHPAKRWTQDELEQGLDLDDRVG
jgi:RHH-type rel operon transcriptional repressor/antitoxin RelB